MKILQSQAGLSEIMLPDVSTESQTFLPGQLAQQS